MVEILQPSPDRIQPPCINAAACGGCHYIHMTYSAQLSAKTAIVRDQLQRITGIAVPPVAPMIPSPLEWHYRNTVQFHLSEEGKIGFQETGSHGVVPIDTCLLCHPAIEEILPALDFEGSSGLERIQARVGVEDELLIVLESTDPVPPNFSVDLALSVVFVGPGGFEENEPLVLAGDDHLIMEACGRRFRVSAGSFFQVNSAQAENMLRYILDHLNLRADTHVLELYAGVGLFSAFLAPAVGRLTAVETSPSAIDDFAVNLDEYDNVDLFAGSAEEILPSLDMRPDVVLVDPPRAGLAIPVIDALVEMKPAVIAYVSCDPATLARDLKRLLAGGYTLEHVQPFDMFPQTYHVETVVLMSRVKD